MREVHGNGWVLAYAFPCIQHSMGRQAIENGLSGRLVIGVLAQAEMRRNQRLMANYGFWPVVCPAPSTVWAVWSSTMACLAAIYISCNTCPPLPHNAKWRCFRFPGGWRFPMFPVGGRDAAISFLSSHRRMYPVSGIAERHHGWNMRVGEIAAN